MINRNLELFIKIAEAGSITKAAKASYITQPAASNALAKLEEELGVKLFFRDKRNGLLLTDIGKQVLHLAKQMEDANQRIYQSAYKERNLISGRLRIAVLTSLVSPILSKPLKEYRRLYPGIELEIKEGTPGEIFSMIEEHSADFAVSCSPFGKFPAIPLVHDRIMTLFPPDFPDKKPFTLNAPPDTLILNKPAYETILDYLPQKGAVNLDRVILVQNAETAIHMVTDGIGVGLLSEYTLDTLSPGQPKYQVSPDITFDIGLFANDLDDLTPAAAEFVKILEREDRQNR